MEELELEPYIPNLGRISWWSVVTGMGERFLRGCATRTRDFCGFPMG